ncbi:MAG TPA: HAD-IC family P-type ATPase [Patescibacteria group bacterium]|nr:HAD-IC family P-type ATPase [Patescibacteria group bacterium]
MEPFHAQSADAVIAALESDEEHGLTSSVAAARLVERGPNELPPEKKPSVILLFLRQFASGLTYVLFAAAAVSFFAGEANDGIGILLAVLVDAVIGFAQERRADHAVEKLKDLVVREASVVRDGVVHRVAARDLVPGDIVVLTEGDRVPADARLFECRDLQTDESSLTGESSEVQKASDPVPAAALLGDRRDMAWMGTSVVSGSGRAVVVETGPRTAFGRIATSLTSIKRERTPLETRLDRLGRETGIFAVGLALVVGFLGYAHGFPLVDMFFFAVALTVSVIPEGLPAVLAIVLAIGVQRMAKRKAIVRHVPSVETLGAADVICTDKTGTLTENKMTVREIAVAGRRLTVSGEGWEPVGDFHADGRHVRPLELPDLDLLLKAAALCNKASIEVREGRSAIVGDPTEGALLVVATKAGIERRDLDREYALINEVPFSSRRKYRAVLEERSDLDGRRTRAAFVVGAFEVLAAKSTEFVSGGLVLAFDEAARREFEAANVAMAGRAMRVLAVATKRMPADQDSLADRDIDGLTLVGLVGMIDPPRQGVARAIARCRGAGIRVIMVTGDQKATAMAIGREIGIVDGGDGAGVYTETDVSGFDDEAFARALTDAAIFARVSPETKLRIVEGLQAAGHVVAMTGDGVNDAPALKKASIGVAMGITGTDVSKEVANMVLADDNFITIVGAVEEGRIAYRNIKQTAAYLFMTNFGEAVTIIACLFFGLPLPLLPAQILWMNLVTDGLPDVALATEPAGGDVLSEPPRKKETPIITRGVLLLSFITAGCMCAGTIAIYLWALRRGELAYARSVAFTTMAMFQLWNVFNMRSLKQSLATLGLFSNMVVFWAVAASFGLQLAVLYVPALRSVFRTVPLGGLEWFVIGFISFGVVVAVEAYKWLCRKGYVPASLQ